MQRLIFIILFSLALISSVRAQEPEPYRIHLPWLGAADMPIACSKPWRLIRPEASTNYVLNPSAETTGNFAAAGGGTATRSATYQHYGLYSYRVQTAANGQGISLTTSTLTATAHTVTFRVRGTLPPAWRVGIGAASKAPRKIEAIDPDWTLYGVEFSAAECSAAAAVTVTQSGAGAGDFYLDGVQVEPLGHWTSYIDGTQEGCKWNGAAHAASSTRSAQSLAGGELLDLWDEFNFFTEEMIGVGAAPLSLDVRNYAILPGGELAGKKIEPRQFTLIGRFIGHSEQELHAKRQALIKALSADSYAAQQPVRLHFSGARVQKRIDAYYEGGLEAELPVTYGTLQADSEEWRYMQYWTERVSIQFLAEDPLWYEIGESAALLDTNDSDTFRYCAGRLADTGQWDNLGLAANPTGSFIAPDVQTIAIGPDGLVYFGGDFTGWNGVAGRDFIVAYNPQTDTWSTVGGASDFNAPIRDLAFGPDGTLYAVGIFTNVAGNAAADYIARKPAGAGWTNLGNPTAGAAAITTAEAIAIDQVGDIYIGGNFTTWANVANADMIVKWDTSAGAYIAVVAACNNTVLTIAIDANNDAYFGGTFTNWGDANGDYIVRWDGSALNSLLTGANALVSALAVNESNLLYLGGQFTAVGGTTASRIASWNGVFFSALAGGVDATVDEIIIAPDNSVIASGSFTLVIGIGVGGHVARWNGASWSHLDVIFPGAPAVVGLTASDSDPVVVRKYDLYTGFNTTGAGSKAGIVTTANDGTSPVYPVVVIARSGGTSATLLSIKNETVGKELLFDYGLLDGETLRIDLEQKSIISSFFGPRLDAIFANSDFGTWSLQPGDNDVTAFIDVAGGPTILAYMLWQDTYRSLD